MRLMRLAITSTFLVAVQALGGAAAGFAQPGGTYVAPIACVGAGCS
jgi:hypothetical protein